MSMKSRFIRILLISVTFLSLIGFAVIWRYFSTGWKIVTDPAIEWQYERDTVLGNVIISTTFHVSDPGKFTSYRLVGGGYHAVIIRINNHEVSQIYETGNLKYEDFTVSDSYNTLSPEMSDRLVSSWVRKGKNTLELQFINCNIDKLDDLKYWKLLGYYRGINVFLKPYSGGVERPDVLTQRPVRIYLNASMPVIPDEPKVPAHFLLTDKDKKLIEIDVKVEARGQTSLIFPQVSYLLKFQKDVDFSILDSQIKPARSWILYAPFLDLSLIRNVLAYDLSRSMGHFSAQSTPVEVIVNGNYQGMYYLMERIENHPNRLNLFQNETDEESVLTNAFLVEIGSSKGSKSSILHHRYGWAILHGLNREQTKGEQYIVSVNSAMESMEYMIRTGSSDLEEVIDFQSFADYIILNEAMKNTDAYRLSTYFHRYNGDDNRRIHAGPVWDFNLSLGNCIERNSNSSEGWIFNTNDGIDTLWPMLMARSDFKTYFRKRYQELRTDLFSDIGIERRIDSLVSLVAVFKVNHYVRFKWPRRKFWPYETLPESYESEIQQIKLFIKNRMYWMDSQLKE